MSPCAFPWANFLRLYPALKRTLSRMPLPFGKKVRSSSLSRSEFRLSVRTSDSLVCWQ